MRILLILGIRSACSLPFRVRPFEALIWALLTTPVFAYLLSPIVGMSVPSYLLILIVSFLGWCLWKRNELDNPAHESVAEVSVVAFFAISFIAVYALTLQWDQFFPMGERLRDYALLSSVIRSPIELQEPWLPGYSLNYYAYWYRFGHFLSSILNVPAPDLYNQLQAFTFSLYLTAIFRLTTRFLRWSSLAGVASAIIIGFGSNLEGVFSVLQRSDNWWGPSRVIPGAIHEFPVWSFLLGDLHPHYLNLAGIPLLLVLFLHIVADEKATKGKWEQVFISALFLGVGSLFIYNSNAWEVPIWGLLIGSFAVARLIERSNRSSQILVELRTLARKPRYWAAIAITLVLCFSLWRSSRNILPNPYPVSLVAGSILQTALLDFIRHWGVPLVLITLSLIVTIPQLVLSGALFLAVAATLLWPTAVPLLITLLVLLCWQFFLWLRSAHEQRSAGEIALFCCGVVAMILCLIPEFIFLNDPYGGENERMNTIFKIYSSNWFIFQLSAIALCVRAFKLRGSIGPVLSNTLVIVSVLILSGFFAHTFKLRKTTTNSSIDSYGSLASAQDNFPGAADAIQFLRSQSGTKVLEAQGNAYAWTSLIATLSDKDSYLGWKNHVDLLIREYSESGRRETVTKKFYSSALCQDRKDILESERIDYAVVGSLEFKQHPGLKSLDFSCLKEVFSKQDYRIYSR